MYIGFVTLFPSTGLRVLSQRCSLLAARSGTERSGAKKQQFDVIGGEADFNGRRGADALATNDFWHKRKIQIINFINEYDQKQLFIEFYFLTFPLFCFRFGGGKWYFFFLINTIVTMKSMAKISAMR